MPSKKSLGLLLWLLVADVAFIKDRGKNERIQAFSDAFILILSKKSK